MSGIEVIYLTKWDGPLSFGSEWTEAQPAMFSGVSSNEEEAVPKTDCKQKQHLLRLVKKIA